MRKEFIVAIILGVSIGLIAMGAFFIRSQGTPLPTSSPLGQIVNTSTPTPTSTPTQMGTLKLNTSLFSHVADEKFSISGETKPESWVAIYNDESSFLVKTSADGLFDTQIDLAQKGLNVLNITSFVPGGEKSDTLTLFVFNTETEADTYFIGSVTDITDDSLQLAKSEVVYPQEQKNEIALVSFGEETQYYNGDKAIELSDLGIADFVVVLGSTDENEVLSAKEIVIVKEPENTSQMLLAGILEVDSDEMNIENSGDIYVLEPENTTDYLIYEDGNFDDVRSIDDGLYDAIVTGEDLGTVFEPSAIYILN